MRAVALMALLLASACVRTAYVSAPAPAARGALQVSRDAATGNACDARSYFLKFNIFLRPCRAFRSLRAARKPAAAAWRLWLNHVRTAWFLIEGAQQLSEAVQVLPAVMCKRREYSESARGPQRRVFSPI